jgi:hypothetical protein
MRKVDRSERKERRVSAEQENGTMADMVFGGLADTGVSLHVLPWRTVRGSHGDEGMSSGFWSNEH